MGQTNFSGPVDSSNGFTINGETILTTSSGDTTVASSDGNVILQADNGVVVIDPDSSGISDNSDVDVTTGFVTFDTTGGATANAMPDGTVSGQLMVLAHTAGGNNAVVTPATFFNGTTITLTLGDSIFLLWVTGAGWVVLGNQGAAIA